MKMRIYHGIHIQCILPTLNAVEQWLREICNSTWVESDSRSCPARQYLAADTMSTWKEGSGLRLCSWKLDLQEQNARSNHGLDGRKGSSCRPSPSAAPHDPPPASPAHLLRYSHLPLVSSIHIPSGILIPPEHSLESCVELFKCSLVKLFNTEQLWAMWNYSLSELFKFSLVELFTTGQLWAMWNCSFLVFLLVCSSPSPSVRSNLFSLCREAGI